MPLQYTFATGTSAPTSDLDANFQTVGLLGIIPCSASGTNALTLTLLNGANTPTVSAYANYLQFSFVATVGNTGAVTARVGALSVLNVYKNTSAGPVALVADDIAAGGLYLLTYNSALSSGAGGFIISVANGEFASSNVTSGAAVVLTSGTISTLTVLPLAAGDWDVWVEGYFTGGASTIVDRGVLSLNTVATINAANGYTSNLIGAGATLFNYGADPSLNLGPARYNLASLTTITALALGHFSTSSMTVYGLMRARRVR